MNFLYHAAHQVAATNPALSRLYIRNMVVVAQKLVLRMYASPLHIAFVYYFFI
jgi:RNase P subunit RPR2